MFAAGEVGESSTSGEVGVAGSSVPSAVYA